MTDELINIIERIKEKITNDSDMVGTRYDTPVQLREELDQCSQQLKQRNKRVIKNLSELFAPTGSLQEHSISNGWSEEFLKLAKQFDCFRKVKAAHSKTRFLIVSALFIALLIIFTIYLGDNFSKYSEKKGDEYFLYVKVLFLLTYVYYFTLLFFYRISFLIVLFIPIINMIFSIILGIAISLMFRNQLDPKTDFYSCSFAHILLTSLFVLRLTKTLRRRASNHKL
jgi:hypothetical protein